MVIHWYGKYSNILKRALLFCVCVDVFVDQRHRGRDRNFVFVVFLLGTIRDEIFQSFVQPVQRINRHRVPGCAGFINDAAFLLFDPGFGVRFRSHHEMNVCAFGQILDGIINHPMDFVPGYELGGFAQLDEHINHFADLCVVRVNLDLVFVNIERFHICFVYWGRLPGPGFNYSTTVTMWVTFIAFPRVPGFPALRQATRR